MKPTIGRIVIYNTTEEDRSIMRNHPQCNVREQLPAIIVGTFDNILGYEDKVNLKLLYDGNCTNDWRTSIEIGDKEGCWNWPVTGSITVIANPKLTEKEIQEFRAKFQESKTLTYVVDNIDKSTETSSGKIHNPVEDLLNDDKGV